MLRTSSLLAGSAMAILVAATTPVFAADVNNAVADAIAAGQYDTALESIERQLAENPDNADLLFQRARVLSFSGKHAEALQEVDALRRRYDSNVDYLLLRAQVLVRLGREPEALADLREATQLAPGYEDVWRLRHSLLLRYDANGAGDEISDVRERAALLFPGSSWWRPPSVVAERAILIGASHDSLDNRSSDWNGQFAEYQWQRSDAASYRVRIARDQRFAGADISLGVAGDYRWSSGWIAGAEFGAANNATAQPDFSFAMHAGRPLQHGWAIDLRYRYRDYSAATVGSVIATIEKYAGDFRLAYGLGWSHLHGASDSTSHVLSGNWYFSERSSAGLSLASGREAEAVGPRQVLETDVRAISVNARHQLSDRLGLQFWLGLHEQGDLYRRRYLGMAFSIRL